MKRFRKSSRKPSRKRQRRTLRRKMKTMKGGIGKDNGKLVFSPQEQQEIERIKTEFKDKMAWVQIGEFEKYFIKNNKKKEYDDVIKTREDDQLLTNEFATVSVH